MKSYRSNFILVLLIQCIILSLFSCGDDDTSAYVNLDNASNITNNQNNTNYNLFNNGKPNNNQNGEPNNNQTENNLSNQSSNNEVSNDTVNITQIIAGTGGTTLDENISEFKMNRDINKKTGEYTITYKVLESLSEHGFVEIRNVFTDKKPTTRHSTPSRRSRSTVKNKYIRVGNGLDFRFHSVKSNSSKRSTRRARVKRGYLYTRSAP